MQHLPVGHHQAKQAVTFREIRTGVEMPVDAKPRNGTNSASTRSSNIHRRASRSGIRHSRTSTKAVGVPSPVTQSKKQDLKTRIHLLNRQDFW
jgi:hypothetical protein